MCVHDLDPIPELALRGNISLLAECLMQEGLRRHRLAVLPVLKPLEDFIQGQTGAEWETLREALAQFAT